MTKEFTVLVGTCGNGIWRSEDSGDSFTWVKGIASVDLIVRGFGVDPHDSRHVVAATAPFVTNPPSPRVGTAHGLHESFDAGASWQPVESFLGIECWRVSFDHAVQGRYFVGTRPSAIYRTEDEGKSFEKLPVPGLTDACFGIGLTRVTSITVHPRDANLIFSSIEINGVRRSLDGGDSWQEVMTNIESPLPSSALFGLDGRFDCHFSGISVGEPDLVLVSTPDAVYASEDHGETWGDFPMPRNFPHQYHRELAIKLDDPNTIFQGTGDDTGGQEGVLLCTKDRGKTWQTVDLPDTCNSPVWCFAQHASDPDVILASTHNGMLFGTDDGGETWRKFRREFSEVRGMCWLPS